MNIHTLYQQDCNLNNRDVSCVNGFINIHTISQCNGSSYFNKMDGGVENVDVSGGHGSVNSHNFYQHNGLISLINYNNSDDMDMNDDLKNGNVGCGIGLINIHTL